MLTKNYDAFLLEQLRDPELAAEYLSAAAEDGSIEQLLIALRAVAEAGFKVVINLAPHEDPRSLPDETSLVQSLGLTYSNIPVPFAAFAPRLAALAVQLAEFALALAQGPPALFVGFALAGRGQVDRFAGHPDRRGCNIDKRAGDAPRQCEDCHTGERGRGKRTDHAGFMRPSNDTILNTPVPHW